MMSAVKLLLIPGACGKFVIFSPAGRRLAKCARRLGWQKRSRYRSIPGNWAQFKLLFRRAGLKWVRGWGYKFIDLLLFVTAALVIGKPILLSCLLFPQHHSSYK